MSAGEWEVTPVGTFPGLIDEASSSSEQLRAAHGRGKSYIEQQRRVFPFSR